MQVIISPGQKVYITFFLFGLLNNVLYVVILSSAVDLVGLSTPKAVVLLADIVPSLLIKVLSPFFSQHIKYSTRVWALVGLSFLGMLMVALLASQNVGMKIVGICMASLSLGLGEVTFLQLTHYYAREYAISGFSSGTGGAGLFGSFVYMLMTNVIGMASWQALLIFSCLPWGFVVAYFGMLQAPSPHLAAYRPISADTMDELEVNPPLSPNVFLASEAQPEWLLQTHMKSTLENITPLLYPYMLPLCLVYISEYVINQGVSPTLLFPLDSLPQWLFSSFRDIYVVYGFLYQAGVFVSRSSVSFGIRIKNLYLLALLQFVNFVICLFQSAFDKPFGSIWPLLLLVFYEGLLGGFLYVNTFMSVSEQVELEKREFSMGCVGISDTFGIVLAGCINWWLETGLCVLQIRRGRDWCLTGKA